MKITKGTILSHYACGNMVRGEVVFIGGKKIVTRHPPQETMSGEKRTNTVIEWCQSRKKPLPLAYNMGKILTEQHFEV